MLQAPTFDLCLVPVLGQFLELAARFPGSAGLELRFDLLALRRERITACGKLLDVLHLFAHLLDQNFHVDGGAGGLDVL